jgi:hypothetical protein
MSQEQKNEQSLSKNDAYTLYESGKKRRYELLFAVNGGAFAIAKLLASDGNKLLPSNEFRVLGHLTLTHLAIGMGLFTILMAWDIYAFGEKMREYLDGEVFQAPGKIVLVLMGVLICAGWLLVGLPTPVSKQTTALLFPVSSFTAYYWFPHLKSR